MGVSLACAVDPTRPALLNAAHRARVNHEVYFFGSEEGLRAFVAEPWRYVGLVTDPVSIRRFRPTATSERRSHGGRLLFFESRETAARFDAGPAAYGVPPTPQAR